MQEKVIFPLSKSDRDALPLVCDIQYLERYSSSAINAKFGGAFEDGVYRGFELSDGGGGVLHIGSDTDVDMLIKNLGDMSLTVHAQHQSSISLVDVGIKLAVCVSVFYDFGVITDQVDSDSKQKAVLIELVDLVDASPSHVVLGEVMLLQDGTIDIDLMNRQIGVPTNTYSKGYIDSFLNNLAADYYKKTEVNAILSTYTKDINRRWHEISNDEDAFYLKRLNVITLPGSFTFPIAEDGEWLEIMVDPTIDIKTNAVTISPPGNEPAYKRNNLGTYFNFIVTGQIFRFVRKNGGWHG